MLFRSNHMDVSVVRNDTEWDGLEVEEDRTTLFESTGRTQCSNGVVAEDDDDSGAIVDISSLYVIGDASIHVEEIGRASCRERV